MNAERRIQRVRRALEPIGDAKPDWQIICKLASAIGHPDGFTFASPEEIWNEFREGCDGARGMTYERLDYAGLQWPCHTDSHAGTPILHVEAFASGTRAPLHIATCHATPEQTTPKYPFILITGRSLYAFNANTMTGRGRMRELRPSDLLEVATTDAEACDLREGDLIRVVSRHGSAALPVRISSAMRPGELFATFHTATAFLNTVTSGQRDRTVGTPEYKVTAVRMERLRAPDFVQRTK